MELYELIEFAKKYNDLGTAVQEQLDDILNGDYDDVNVNAYKLIKKYLGNRHDELDEALSDCAEYHEED